jgi:hypothetical protein
MAYFPYYYSFNANDRHNQELLDETFSIATGSELGSIYSVFDDIPQSSTSQVPSQFTEDNYSGQQQHYQQQYQEQYQQQDPQQYKQQHQQLLDPQQQQINIPRSVSMPPQTQQRTFPFIIEPCTLKKRTSMSDSDRKFVCPVCNHR